MTGSGLRMNWFLLIKASAKDVFSLPLYPEYPVKGIQAKERPSRLRFSSNNSMLAV
jgi:hypothetical protein